MRRTKRWISERRTLLEEEMCEAADIVQHQITLFLAQEDITDEQQKDFLEALCHVRVLLNNPDDQATRNELIALSKTIEGARIPWRQNLALVLGGTSTLAIVAGATVLTLVGLGIAVFPPLTIALISLGVALFIATGIGAIFLHRSGKPVSLAAALLDFAAKAKAFLRLDQNEQAQSAADYQHERQLTGISVDENSNTRLFKEQLELDIFGNITASVRGDTNPFADSLPLPSSPSPTIVEPREDSPSTSFDSVSFRSKLLNDARKRTGRSETPVPAKSTVSHSVESSGYTNIFIKNGREINEELARECNENTVVLAKKPGTQITYSAYFIQNKAFVMQERNDNTTRKFVDIDFTDQEIKNLSTTKSEFIDKVVEKLQPAQSRSNVIY